MNQEEYRKAYLCEFKIDQRKLDLENRLNQYYKDMPDSMDNKTAYLFWNEFKRWCFRNGYTQKEINRAKMEAPK